MRPFGPLAGLCLLLSIILQLALVVHPCKEIKLKFDLQRMVESESNFFVLKLVFTQFLTFFRDGKEDLCRDAAHHQGHGDQHYPRAGREGEEYHVALLANCLTTLYTLIHLASPRIYVM